MSAASQGPDLDDVLDAFAAEASPDDVTLADYIQRYPEHALALADLAHELRLNDGVAECTTQPDTAWLEASWHQFAVMVPAEAPRAEEAATDPFASVAPARMAEIRRALDIPSSVLMAFRDRLVLAASVPMGFVRRLAAELQISAEGLSAYLGLPPRMAPAASHKSDQAPSTASDKVTFEALLEQAMVPPDRRRALLGQDD